MATLNSLPKPPFPTLNPGHILAQGVIGAWAFYEGTGTVLTDLSGNGNNGTLNGCTWKGEKAGWALGFNGSSDYVSIPNVSSLQIGNKPLGVAFWLKATGINFQPIGKSSWLGNGEWAFQVDGNGKITFYTEANNGSVQGATYGTAINDGNWHLVVGTQDVANGKVRISVDGSAFVSTTISVTPQTNSANLVIGASADATPGHFTNGTIDSAILFNRVLDINDVQLLNFDIFGPMRHNSGNQVLKLFPGFSYGTLVKPPSPKVNPDHPLSRGLVGAWTFSEGSGNKVRDVSGNNNDGTVQNSAAPVWIGSPYGWAYTLKTTGNYFFSNAIKVTQFTLSCVLQSPTGQWNNNCFDSFLNQRSSGNTATEAYLFGPESPGNDLSLSLRVGNASANAKLTVTPTVDITQWHHYVATYDGVTGKIYVDGNLIGSSALNITIAFAGTPNSLAIGDDSGAGLGRALSANIAQASVHNRAMSANEVAMFSYDTFQMMRFPRQPELNNS